MLSKPLPRLLPIPHPSRALLVSADNLVALQAAHHTLRGRVSLIYLDPPFFTGRTHERVIRESTTRGKPPRRRLRPAFEDKWQDLPSYLDALRARLERMKELLAPHGSVVVHVDPKTSHYVKVLGDELFGMDNFASEIIWRYRRWPSKTRNFQKVHDVLLRWVADWNGPPRFHQLYEPLAASTVKTWGKGKQRAVFDETGRRRRSSTEKAPSPGAPLGDVWEIPIVAPVARERTGYPTQKPEALLERLILACTDPGDLVLDPYMGSGTTLAVACRLGRAAIGIDAGADALEVTEQRLQGKGISYDTVALDHGYTERLEQGRSEPSTGTLG